MSLIRYRKLGWPFEGLFDVDFKKDFSMKTDLKENDKEYEFSIDLPGFNKKDIKVLIEDGYLIIEATREKSEADEKENYIHKERSYGKYSRSFYLGDIDDAKVNAKYKDGVLKVIVPKDEIEETKKYISIK